MPLNALTRPWTNRPMTGLDDRAANGRFRAQAPPIACVHGDFLHHPMDRP
jgi:hypothetical protein